MRLTPWWIMVEVGTKLRKVDHDGDKLLHVVATFEDDGMRMVVTKTWWSSKQRWHYEVFSQLHACVGTIYPDGEERPE